VTSSISRLLRGVGVAAFDLGSFGVNEDDALGVIAS
jgi:hypothetical protein